MTRSSHHRRGGRSDAFSLIELIVVIGIIAILIGLLMPSVMRVRAQAQTLVCLSQLRQIGLAMAMYRNAHAGRWYPAGIMKDDGGQYHTYDELLVPHLGNAAARVFVCPDDFVERNEPRSYSLNDRLWDPANGYNNQGAVPASFISRPTETICLSEYFVDGNTLGFPGYHTVRSPIGDAERLNFHYHNGNWMGTVLWFDGHATALRPGELRRMDGAAADHLYAEAIDWMEYRWSK